MKFRLSRRSPLGIKDQIKRQIRIVAECGELLPGQALPSSKDLAKSLNVNRNTVSAAYRELVAEGILETVVGSGTFIRGKRSHAKTDALRKIVDEALEKAVRAGFTPEQITDFWLHRLTTSFAGAEGRRVVVVECNREALDDISAVLRKDLSVETTSLLIQDIEANPLLAAEHLVDADLVVCGFNHVEEFRKAVPESPVEVVAALLKPEIRIMNELMRLPPGTTVGFTCANQRSTETFYKEAIFFGGSTLVRIWAGLDNQSELQRLLERCQVIFASVYVHDRILEMTGPRHRVIKVDLGIDQANIDLIRERLIVASIINP